MNLGMDMGNWAWLKGPMFSPRKSKSDDNRPTKTSGDTANETTQTKDAALPGSQTQVGAGADFTVTPVDGLALSDALVTDHSNMMQDGEPEESVPLSATPSVPLDPVPSQQQSQSTTRSDSPKPQSPVLLRGDNEVIQDNSVQTGANSGATAGLEPTLSSSTYSELVASLDAPSTPFHTCSTKLRYKMVRYNLCNSIT